MSERTPTSEWLTSSQTMAYLQISRPTLYRRIEDGSLVRYKMGSAIRFLRSDVEAMIQPEPQNDGR